LKLFLRHIAYSEETKSRVAEGFSLVDNTLNPRPDWFEYWPIRSTLPETLTEMAAEDYLGYFSPRFFEKTGLTAKDLEDFAMLHGTSADILLFSPQPDISAFFVNVFAGEDFFNPGFFSASQNVLATIGVASDLSKLITDSRNTVFSNYFLARPDFWRQWFALTEKIFILAESEIASMTESENSTVSGLNGMTSAPSGISPSITAEVSLGNALVDSPQSQEKSTARVLEHLPNEASTRSSAAPCWPSNATLTIPTNYGKGAHRKVFLIERIATLMIAASIPRAWRAKAYEPFRLAWSAHFTHSQHEAVLCDALKIAFQATGFSSFGARYHDLRTTALNRLYQSVSGNVGLGAGKMEHVG
jgi:hypothetical protein